jgi:hypothetical protein
MISPRRFPPRTAKFIARPARTGTPPVRSRAKSGVRPSRTVVFGPYQFVAFASELISGMRQGRMPVHHKRRFRGLGLQDMLST